MMFIRFDRIHKCDRQTDRQTHRQTDTTWRHRTRLHSIARQKLISDPNLDPKQNQSLITSRGSPIGSWHACHVWSTRVNVIVSCPAHRQNDRRTIVSCPAHRQNDRQTHTYNVYNITDKEWDKWTWYSYVPRRLSSAVWKHVCLKLSEFHN